MQQVNSSYERQKSIRQKPRLSVQQVEFISQKLKPNIQKIKRQFKPKFSTINLKDVLLTGLNHQHQKQKQISATRLNPQKQNLTNKFGRSYSFANHLPRQTVQHFIIKNHKQSSSNQIKQQNAQDNKTKTKSSFLPSIIKNIVLKETTPRQKNDDQKHFISLQLDGISSYKRQENIPIFKKLRSQSLNYLQNKIKLQKAKQKNNKNQHQNVQKKEQFFSEQNKDDQQKVQSAQKQKKFYINNINLETCQNFKQPLKKRNFILKYLQKNEKQMLGRAQSRKNSLNINEQFPRKISPSHFYRDNNLISKKVVFTHPQQIVLKKIQGSIKKEVKDRKFIKYEWLEQQKLIKNPNNKRDYFNGWDIQNENDSRLLIADENQKQVNI